MTEVIIHIFEVVAGIALYSILKALGSELEKAIKSIISKSKIGNNV